MICIWRRRKRIWLASSVSSSSPSSLTEPDVGSISRSTDLAVVVLPQPDSPTRDKVSPRASVNETPSTAWIGGLAGLNQCLGEMKCLRSLLTSSSGGAFILPAPLD